jgi:tetratricopeptide (TPR) repeat protein
MIKDASLSIFFTIMMTLLLTTVFPALIVAQDPGQPRTPLTEKQMASMALRLADELYQKKMFSDAIPQFRLAAKLQPQEAIFHQRLGDGLLKTGKVREALKEYEEANACPISPRTSAWAWLLLIHETEKAISVLKEGRVEPEVCSSF